PAGLPVQAGASPEVVTRARPAEGGMNRGVVTTLRDSVPPRPLLRAEALRIAELQAQKFLALMAIAEPPVPKSIIAELPRVQVAVLRPFPVSGATQWKSGRWLIVLNGREPETRR